jgi:hypothetical protein
MLHLTQAIEQGKHNGFICNSLSTVQYSQCRLTCLWRDLLYRMNKIGKKRSRLRSAGSSESHAIGMDALCAQSAIKVVFPNPAGATTNVRVRLIPSQTCFVRRSRSARFCLAGRMDTLVRKSGSMKQLYCPKTTSRRLLNLRDVPHQETTCQNSGVVNSSGS